MVAVEFRTKDRNVAGYFGSSLLFLVPIFT